MNEQREQVRRTQPGKRAPAQQDHPFRIVIAILKLTAIVCVAIVLLEGLQSLLHREPEEPMPGSEPQATVTEPPTVATEPPVTTVPTEPDLSQIPDRLLELMERNPEATDFVLNYPQEHDKPHEVNVDRYKNSPTVPLYIQWDPMWGYLDYGGNEVGLSACGPMCLAMAGSYVTGDYETFRPDRMIQFAIDEGYRVPGNGTMWSLISEGGEKLGLDGTEIPLVKGHMADYLEEGDPIICIVGPGPFTEDGHFIVLTGYEDGKFRVNDPNSPARSAKLWDFEEFSDSVRNLWVIRAK